MKLILESQNPRKDIEALAKSRTNRAEGNKLTYYMGILALAVVGGAYIVRYSTIIGLIIACAGIVGFYWYIGKLNKRTSIVKNLLLREWEKEKEKEKK